MPRKKTLHIEYEKVLELRRHPDRYTWEEIAQAFQCSRISVIRAYRAGPALRPQPKRPEATQ